MGSLGFRTALFGRTSARALAAALSLDFTTGVLDPRVTFSRTSNAMMYDSTGKLTFAPSNVLLNSATLSTQSVTLAASSYILSFKGTGSVTLSGTSSGTLNGTGASDRVSLKFTATAGSTTFTVSGTVTEAQCERVTYQTSPRTYNATTASAYYGPRFDYDPSTLAAKGLLIEESRTNLLTYSEQFDNAAWTKAGAVVTANSDVAPDGTTTADTVADDTTGSFESINQAPAKSGNTHTASIYIKKDATGRATRFVILRVAYTGGTAKTFDVALDTSTGETSVSGSASVPDSYGAVDTGDYWRIYITGTDTGANTAHNVFFFPAGGASSTWAYSSGATGSCIVWGAQLEAGSFATSYIPTVATSVTRAADSASMTGTNFSDWFSATAGTFLTEFSSPANGTRAILAVNDATANEQMALRTEALDPFFRVADGGVEQAAIDAGAVAANTFYKLAAAYSANDFAVSIAGGAAVADTLGTLPLVTQMQIGVDQAGNRINGHIKSISFYNSRKSNADLQTLTAA